MSSVSSINSDNPRDEINPGWNAEPVRRVRPPTPPTDDANVDDVFNVS